MTNQDKLSLACLSLANAVDDNASMEELSQLFCRLHEAFWDIKFDHYAQQLDELARKAGLGA